MLDFITSTVADYSQHMETNSEHALFDYLYEGCFQQNELQLQVSLANIQFEQV